MSAVAAATTERTRRVRTRTGLTATIVAIIASVLAYALQGLGVEGQTPAGLVTYGIVFAVLALGGWYAVRRLARDADPVLYPTAVLLGGLAQDLFAGQARTWIVGAHGRLRLAGIAGERERLDA